MITREDILSIEFLKKTEYHGCHQGMRYRLEKVETDGTKQLLCTVWPEPFNYFTTPEEQKTRNSFSFDEDGIVDAIAWMNDRLFDGKDTYDHAKDNWKAYELPKPQEGE